MGLSRAGASSPKSQISFGVDPEGPAEAAGAAEAAGMVGTMEAMGAAGARMVMISWVGLDSLLEDSAADNSVPESLDSALGSGVALQ
jgi:hypothetical protein